MEYGVYIFFALVQLTAALFVYYLLPETVGVPIENGTQIALDTKVSAPADLQSQYACFRIFKWYRLGLFMCYKL